MVVSAPVHKHLLIKSEGMLSKPPVHSPPPQLYQDKDRLGNDQIEKAANHQKEFSVDTSADQKSKINAGKEDCVSSEPPSKSCVISDKGGEQVIRL